MAQSGPEHRLSRPEKCPLGKAGRRRALVVVELAYALLCLAASVPLIFALGPVAEAANLTSVRILGGALIAFAFGAFAVARDPVRNRALFQVELVFTGVAAMSLLWRLAVDGSRLRTWLVLAPLSIGLALLVWLYPATRE